MNVPIRKTLFVWVACLWAVPANVQEVAAAVVVTENFDTPGTSTADLTIGTSPSSAMLVGGTKNDIVGFGNLYDTGVRAWMFRPGETGDIQLESPIIAIDVFFAHLNGLSGRLAFFAADNSLVASLDTLDAGTSMPSRQELDFAVPVTDIQLTISGPDALINFVAIDSLALEFVDPAVVPLPTALPLFASALIGLGLAVRRRQQAP